MTLHLLSALLCTLFVSVYSVDFCYVYFSPQFGRQVYPITVNASLTSCIYYEMRCMTGMESLCTSQQIADGALLPMWAFVETANCANYQSAFGSSTVCCQTDLCNEGNVSLIPQPPPSAPAAPQIECYMTDPSTGANISSAPSTFDSDMFACTFYNTRCDAMSDNRTCTPAEMEAGTLKPTYSYALKSSCPIILSPTLSASYLNAVCCSQNLCNFPGGVSNPPPPLAAGQVYCVVTDGAGNNASATIPTNTSSDSCLYYEIRCSMMDLTGRCSESEKASGAMKMIWDSIPTQYCSNYMRAPFISGFCCNTNLCNVKENYVPPPPPPPLPAGEVYCYTLDYTTFENVSSAPMSYNTSTFSCAYLENICPGAIPQSPCAAKGQVIRQYMPAPTDQCAYLLLNYPTVYCCTDNLCNTPSNVPTTPGPAPALPTGRIYCHYTRPYYGTVLSSAPYSIDASMFSCASFTQRCDPNLGSISGCTEADSAANISKKVYTFIPTDECLNFTTPAGREDALKNGASELVCCNTSHCNAPPTSTSAGTSANSTSTSSSTGSGTAGTSTNSTSTSSSTGSGTAGTSTNSTSTGTTTGAGTSTNSTSTGTTTGAGTSTNSTSTGAGTAGTSANSTSTSSSTGSGTAGTSTNSTSTGTTTGAGTSTNSTSTGTTTGAGTSTNSTSTGAGTAGTSTNSTSTGTTTGAGTGNSTSGTGNSTSGTGSSTSGTGNSTSGTSTTSGASTTTGTTTGVPSGGQSLLSCSVLVLVAIGAVMTSSCNVL